MSVDQLKRVANRVIRNEIMSHLRKLQYDEKPEKAFGPDGLVEFNSERIKEGKPPIFSVRVIEEGSVKDSIGKIPLYTKERKLEVEKGGNYCVAFYEHPETKERKFDVVSFFDAVQLKTSGENPFQTEKGIEYEKQGYRQIFTLTHYDLVYVPVADETIETIDWNKSKNLFTNIYRVVKFSGLTIYFQPHNFSKEITMHEGKASSAKDYKGEFSKGTNGTEFVLGTDISIKSICIKILVDRLGNIKPII